MAWVPGQKLHGDRYTIERFLGQGGFGVAYLAQDKKGDRIVIKTLKDKVIDNPKLAPYRLKYQMSFREEALRLALCRHPHIVQIENAFYEGEFPCIAMEYVEGEDLRHRIKNYGPLPELEALQYVRQIGQAVGVMHEKGLLHQDLKPPNIMVRAGRSEAVLIDFGIARDFITTTIDFYRTLGYTDGFSPTEQYNPDGKRGEYTDVYALAATLYYILTGRVPTSAPARTSGKPLIDPKQHKPGLSEWVSDAILAGLALEPSARPQSMAEWLKLLGNDELTAPSLFKPRPVAPQMVKSTMPPTTPTRPTSPPRADYTRLRDLLAQKQWKEADLETERVMLEVARTEKEDWLNLELIHKFPWEDLRTINQLWLIHSNGRFGFSVQKRIWQEVGGRVDYQTERRLGDRVGWRHNNSWLHYDELTFAISAPPGHLPARGSALWARGSVFFGWAWWVFFDKGVFSRMETCKL